MTLTHMFARRLPSTYEKLGLFTGQAFAHIFTPIYWTLYPPKWMGFRQDGDVWTRVLGCVAGTLLWAFAAPIAAVCFVTGLMALTFLTIASAVVFPLALIADLFLGLANLANMSSSHQGLLPTVSLSSTARLAQKGLRVEVESTKTEKNDEVFAKTIDAKEDVISNIDDSLLVEKDEKKNLSFVK